MLEKNMFFEKDGLLIVTEDIFFTDFFFSYLS